MYNYNWTLADANFTKDRGKVFTCFACGGGSSMGYKLSGFDVIGCNDNDPAMMAIYRDNHNPTFPFLSKIQDFKNQTGLPEELFDLDILDGSPPCSSFSMSGNREKDWGKEKKFREGQAEQVLDTLFFDFVDLAERLQPKVIIAENVKGLIMGEAQTYVAKILNQFDAAGYFVDFKLLNSMTMGVPQRRERVFFYAVRKDLYVGRFIDLFQTRPELVLDFRDRPIMFKEYRSEQGNPDAKIPPRDAKALKFMQPKDKTVSDVMEREFGKVSGFNSLLIGDGDVYPTIVAGAKNYRKFDKMECSKSDYILTGTFPMDYRFGKSEPKYVIGMSVPPIMVARIADCIHDQWLVPMRKKD